MINVSNDFKLMSKKVRQQDVKLSIVEKALVEEIKLVPDVVYYNTPIQFLKASNRVIAKEVKYSFEGQLFKTIMKRIELTVKNVNELKDKNVDFQYGIYVNNDFEYVDLGNFYIKDIEDDKKKEELVATGYDKMLNFMIPFKQNDLQLTYPCKMYELVNRMGEVCGVEIYSTNFFNADLEVEEDFFTVQEITYRDVLEKIAQATLTTIFIKDNKLYLHKLDTNIFEKLDKSYIKNLVILEKFGPVNALVLGRGSVEENIESVDQESINNNGRCEIRFDENEFLDNKRSKVIESMLNEIKGLEYYSFESSNTGVMWLEPCDCVKLGDREDNFYKSFYLKANITINTGIVADSEADILEETNTVYKVTNKEEKKTLRVERLAKKNEGLIQDIIVENTEMSEKVAEIKTTMNSIEQSVSAFYDFTKSVKGKNEIRLENALDTNILKLTLNAENMQGGLFPSKNLFPSKKLFPRKAGATITIVVSRNSRYADKPLIFPSSRLFPNKKLYPRSNSNFRKEFKFVLDKPLLEYNNVHDQLVVEFNQEKGTCVVKVLRKLKKENEVYYIYGQAREEIIQELDFKLYKGVNYIYIKEYKNWNMEAEYIFNSELNKYYTTKIEMGTKIKQLADEIILEVKQETDTDKLISKINMKPGQIDMTGLVTANENFKILKDGSIEAKNGSFSGNILLDDGSEIIGGKGLLTNLSFTGNGLIKTASLGTFYQVGYCRNNLNSTNYKSRIDIDAYIPDNFIIEKAVVVISHFGLDVYYNGKSYGKGYSRNLNVFTSDMDNRILTYNMGSEYQDTDSGNLQKITGAMDNWTPDISNNKVDINVTNDIKNSLKNGLNRITIQSDGNIPNYNINENSDYMQQGMIDYIKQTGMVSATLQIIGYMKPEKKEDEQENE